MIEERKDTIVSTALFSFPVTALHAPGKRKESDLEKECERVRERRFAVQLLLWMILDYISSREERREGGIEKGAQGEGCEAHSTNQGSFLKGAGDCSGVPLDRAIIVSRLKWQR